LRGVGRAWAWAFAFDKSRHRLWEDIYAGQKKGKIGIMHMLARRVAK
jgi:hypothetical protein